MTSQLLNVPATQPAPKVPNASPLPAPSRVPGTPRRRRRSLNLWLVGAGGLLAVVVMTGLGLAWSKKPQHQNLVTHTVGRERLELTVVERGALESADNNDVYCRVKSGAKGSTVSTTIK